MKKNYLVSYLLILCISTWMGTVLQAQTRSNPDKHALLSGFSLTVLGPNIIIDWATEQQASSAYFEVERAGKDQIFLPIARVEGFQSNPSEGSYEAIDESPLSGPAYYRIKRINVDGDAHVYEALAISSRSGSDFLEIRNLKMLDQSLNMQILNPSEAALKAELLGLNGQVVKKDMIAKGSSQISLSMGFSTLSRGLYIIRLTAEDGQTTDRKFLF